MADMRGDTAGYTLVFYDITDAVSRDEPGAQRREAKRQLQKIPTVSGNRIVLVDADERALRPRRRPLHLGAPRRRARASAT